MAFSGFPDRPGSIPTPGPLFGTLLEEIDDLAEMKCVLRVIWLLHQKRRYPRFVTLNEILADRTLVKALSTDGSPDHDAVKRALDRAVERGVLASAPVQRDGQQERLYTLNTDAGKRALAGIAEGKVAAGPLPKAEPWEGALERPNVFALYEDNIGMLSPMIADELREAEQMYPQSWIEDAFREAVSQNKRSWRYISRILERWDREGRSSDGKSGRYPKKNRHY